MGNCCSNEAESSSWAFGLGEIIQSDDLPEEMLRASYFKMKIDFEDIYNVEEIFILRVLHDAREYQRYSDYLEKLEEENIISDLKVEFNANSQESEEKTGAL
jgi:hypothetical protein